MKMEHPIVAPKAGIVRNVGGVVGDLVSDGNLLFVVEDEESGYIVCERLFFLVCKKIKFPSNFTFHVFLWRMGGGGVNFGLNNIILK